jgi:glycosyltransferase involved in cell wall biosynthesis
LYPYVRGSIVELRGDDRRHPRNPKLMPKEPQPAEITKPLLTIAIPTYNRAKCLKELLSVLADQLKDEPRVELIISDNASPDETPSVVRDFLHRGLCVRYIRNAQNIGPDANFLQCFEQALGKYVWLFSDDDLIVRGGLAKILGYCAAAEYDLLWVSAYSFGKFRQTHAATPRFDAVEISDAKAYVKRIHIFFTFITGNIINKETVLRAGPKPFSSLVGTGLMQLGWAYTALNEFSRGLYIREKLLAVRENSTGGYRLFQVFGPTLATITKTWLSSANLGRIVMNGTIQRFWPSMLLQYKKSATAFADEASPQVVLTPIFKDNIRYWVFAYPVIALPSLLASVWVFLIRIFNRLDKTAGFPTLYWEVPGTGWHRWSKNL